MSQDMGGIMLEFLSHDYSGLIMALIVMFLTWAGLRLRPGRAMAWMLRLAGLAAIVLAIGAVSHLVRVARIDAAYPPPGKLVDVGGYKMHVLAEGPANGPAIVWFPGAHFGGAGFYTQHKAVRDQVRSILVDRPGTGWSDTGPFPRTTAREADEIMRALAAAGEKGPFIFAGWSFGGLLAANIARRYPDNTAALALIDPTPLDVLFYGADKKGLAAWYRQSYYTGLRRIFGLYWFTPRPVDGQLEAAGGFRPFEEDPVGAALAVETHAGSSFANGSILTELAAHGLVERAWDTVVFDGELGETPLYLIAPGEDSTTLPYAESVLGPGPDAERFAQFLKATRERFMAASANSTRIYAPAGTSHVFPDEAPEFLTETMLRIASDARAP